MATYITEPSTKGKVTLKTSLGDLDIELWAKETPKACRNFVQLCLEGYFDNTIFHRIVKGFLIQGGDPTGTGFGGESIYGKPFETELHGRIRFSHRGLVAMANSPDDPTSNNSQFFITLVACEQLNGKHTIFGKITGESLFNVLKANDYQLDKDDRPLYPPKIHSANVLANPFDDIVPRPKKEVKKEVEKKVEPKKQKNMSLLSFSEDAEFEEESHEDKNLKMKSAIFYSDDPEAKKAAEKIQKEKERMIAEKSKESKEKVESKEKKEEPTTPPSSSGIEKKEKRKKRNFDDSESEDEEEVVTKNEKIDAIKEEQQRLKKEILSLKRKEREIGKEAQQSLMTPVEQQRAKFLKKKMKRSEDEIISKLTAFRSSLKTAESSTPNEEETEIQTDAMNLPIIDDTPDNSKDDSWKTHKLKFQNEKRAKDPFAAKEEEYTAFDPLKGKKKDKTMNEHQRKLRAVKKDEKW